MRPATRKKQETETALKRHQIARLYLQGVTQEAIGEKLGIDQSNVSRHLAAIRDDWRKSAVSDYNEIKAAELAQINEVQRNAWEAWAKSRLGPDGKIVNEGNPQFLNVIDKMIGKRMAIYGLAAPLQIMGGGTLPWLEAEPTDIDAKVIEGEAKRIEP